MNDLITVVIRTINRKTLINSINSALKQTNNVIVIADCVDLPFSSLPKEPKYLKINKKINNYCSVGINLAAIECSTPYFCLLDDDDEFTDDAIKIMTEKISNNPDVDIYIPGLLYNDNTIACVNSIFGVRIGNICVPTYKTDLVLKFPFTFDLINEKRDPHHIDFYHVYNLYTKGYKIDWYGKPLIRVRPLLSGKHGTYSMDKTL